MRTLDSSGKSVADAIEKGCRELGVSQQDVICEVLEEPTKGFLGIGSKEARVRITCKEKGMPAARSFLNDVTGAMGVDIKIEEKFDGENHYFILSGDKIGILIGRRGQTLDSLQYLVNLVANKGAEEKVRIILDAEDYRQRREDTLRQLAFKMADRVRRSARKVILEPMNSQERRIIHQTLQDDLYVRTYSEGEDPNRQLIIVPKGEGDKKRKEFGRIQLGNKH